MKKFYNLKIKINKEQNLCRLDQTLAKLSNNTRSQIKIMLLNGSVKKKDKVFKDPSYKVKLGEEYHINLTPLSVEKFEAEDISLDIVYEDEDLLIINKPSGMVTHPAPGNRQGTLVNALIYYLKKNLSNINDGRPGIIHRLDKETSGLLVIAKNNQTHVSLSKQFKDHSISRKYYAIVWGVPSNQKVEGYISRDSINRKKMKMNNSGKGKFSSTEIKLMASYQIASLVKCKLKTGRTHQVRLHMNYINSPVVGDKVYGKNNVNKFGKKRKDEKKFLILKNFSRQALHAYLLGFKHPRTNTYLEFKKNVPKDMQDLLDLIVKY